MTTRHEVNARLVSESLAPMPANPDFALGLPGEKALSEDIGALSRAPASACEVREMPVARRSYGRGESTTPQAPNGALHRSGRQEVRAKQWERSRRQQGAAMMIVMLVLLMSTGIATFAVRSTVSEIRASGHMRRALQTQHVAEAGIAAAFALVDRDSPAALLYAMDRSDPQPLDLYEPALASGKRAYRLKLADFTAAAGANGVPLNLHTEQSGSLPQPFDQDFMVDVTDDRVFTAVVPGERSDGESKFTYLYATYTARGRTRVGQQTAPEGDHQIEGDPRAYNESASDSRAFAISGPFSWSK